MTIPDLTTEQIAYLKMLARAYPEPVTIWDEGGHLLALRDADFIDQYDMWPDGTRRWTITADGLRALQAKEGQ